MLWDRLLAVANAAEPSLGDHLDQTHDQYCTYIAELFELAEDYAADCEVDLMALNDDELLHLLRTLEWVG